MIISQVILQLEHVLYKVVSVRILDQEVDSADDHVSQGKLLRLKALLETALHYTAAVLVRTNLITIRHAGLIDKLSEGSIVLRSRAVFLLRRVRSFESQQESLDHMIAIRVSGQVKDILRHLCADREDLLLKHSGLLAEHFDQCLHDSGAVKIHRNFNQLVQTVSNENFDTVSRGHFNELLAKIVSELVRHDIGEDVEHRMDQ